MAAIESLTVFGLIDVQIKGPAFGGNVDSCAHSLCLLHEHVSDLPDHAAILHLEIGDWI